MTRQDQIIQAASEMFKDSEMRVPNMCCFRQGAEWADNHPQWHRCDDELPELGKRVLIAVTQKNIINISIAYREPINVFYPECRWCWSHNFSAKNVIAWMPLPQYIPTTVDE